MLDNKKQMVPGCESYTRPEEIQQMSKFLKKVHKYQDDHTELDDYNIAVHGAFSGMIPNIDKLEDLRIPLEDTSKFELDKDSIKLDVDKDVNLNKTRIDLDDNTKVSLSDEALKLDVEELNGLDNNLEKLNVDNNVDLPDESIKLENANEVVSLDDRAVTLDKEEDEITGLPDEVVTLDKPEKSVSLSDDIDKLKDASSKDIDNLDSTKVKLDTSEKVDILSKYISKLEPSADNIEELDSPITKLEVGEDVELKNDRESLSVSDIKDLDSSIEKLNTGEENIALSEDKEQLNVIDSTKLANDKVSINVTDVDDLNAELEHAPEDRQDSESFTSDLIERTEDSEFLDYLNVKINNLKELTGDDLYNGVLELLSDERFGEWGEKISSYLSSYANRESERAKVVDNKNPNLSSDVNDYSRFKEVLQNSLIYSPVPSDINVGITNKLKEFLENNQLISEGESLPDAVNNVIIELYKKTQDMGINETTRQAVEEVINERIVSNYKEDLLESENTEYLIEELTDSLEAMLNESVNSESDIVGLSTYYEKLVNPDGYEELSSDNGETPVIGDQSRLASLLNKYSSKAASYSTALANKLFGDSTVGKSIKTALSRSVLSLIITARDSIEEAAGVSAISLPGTPMISSGITTAQDISSRYDYTTSSSVQVDAFTNPVNRPDGTNNTHFWAENGVKEVPSNTDSINKKIDEVVNTIKTNALNDSDKNAKLSLGSFAYTFSDNYLAGLGISTTLSDLCNTTPSQIGSVEELNSVLTSSPYISSPRKYMSTKESGFRTFTLDGNSHWEIKLEPFTAKSNGYYSFLPAIQEINVVNSLLHGVNTNYSKWIPVNSFELQKSKMKTKSAMLAEGEIYYPTGVDMFNEFRMTVVDDQYKSWKSYFEKCMEVSIYNSETHDYQYYKDMSKFKYQDTWKLANTSSATDILSKSTTEEDVKDSDIEIGHSESSENVTDSTGRKGVTTKVTKYKAKKIAITENTISRTTTNADVKRSRTDLGGVDSVGITAVDKSHILVPNFRNVTFKCTILVMTPQLSTIKKYVLLLVLKDYPEEYSGEVDSSAGDLSLSFSIVGENPHDDDPPELTRWSKSTHLGTEITNETKTGVITRVYSTTETGTDWEEIKNTVTKSEKNTGTKKKKGSTKGVSKGKEVPVESGTADIHYYWKLKESSTPATDFPSTRLGGSFYKYYTYGNTKEDYAFNSDGDKSIAQILAHEKQYIEVYKKLQEKITVERCKVENNKFIRIHVTKEGGGSAQTILNLAQKGVNAKGWNYIKEQVACGLFKKTECYAKYKASLANAAKAEKDKIYYLVNNIGLRCARCNDNGTWKWVGADGNGNYYISELRDGEENTRRPFKIDGQAYSITGKWSKRKSNLLSAVKASDIVYVKWTYDSSKKKYVMITDYDSKVGDAILNINTTATGNNLKENVTIDYTKKLVCQDKNKSYKVFPVGTKVVVSTGSKKINEYYYKNGDKWSKVSSIGYSYSNPKIMNASDVSEHQKKGSCVRFSSSSKTYYAVYMQYGNYYTYVNKVKKELAKNSSFTKISELQKSAQKTGNIYKVLDKNGNNII